MKKKVEGEVESGQALTVQGNNSLAVWEQNVGRLLTPDVIKQYLCPAANDTELFLFIQLCKNFHLNPFTRDAYLVKYKKDSPASMVVGKDTYHKRADAHPQYDGMKSGIIVTRGTIREYREGAMCFKGEELVGGWAEVYRKDRKIPFRAEVSMAEYEGKKYDWQTKKYVTNSMWEGKPSTMIVKVAEVQALRKAFPTEFQGLYVAEEMELGNEVLSSTPIDMNQIKEPKRKIIDVQPEAGADKGEPNKKEEPANPPVEQTNPEEKQEEIKDDKPAEVTLPAKPPTDFRQQQIASLIEALDIRDSGEKADFVKILQEKVGIPAEREVADYTQDEAVKMVEILKKQVGVRDDDGDPFKEESEPRRKAREAHERGEEPQGEAEPPKEEQQEPAKKKAGRKKAPASSNHCEVEGCTKYITKKVAEYSKKKYGKIFCYDHQPRGEGGK